MYSNSLDFSDSELCENLVEEDDYRSGASQSLIVKFAPDSFSSLPISTE